MRGLRGEGLLRQPRGAVVCAAVVSLLLVAALMACTATSTGTRDEGPARSEPVASSPTGAASPTPRVRRADAVELLKADPEVDPGVKRDLKPCVGDEYPVDVSYGDLTGAKVSDIVVNVLTCGDAVGVGAYVYRAASQEKDAGQATQGYVNVFRNETPPVYAEIDRGDLVVTRQMYDKGDAVAYPSGEEVVTYHWKDGTFAELYRMHNDYSNTVTSEPPQALGGSPAAVGDGTGSGAAPGA
ncbi:lipoprotein CseA [Streptomyces gougerotii]|uniref:Lipoprotein CseA n=3 Tax=Streptomyces TaxID=1883 RepID=A0A8H9HWU4_9ACTN|nr:hypothetical protein [Streptomyces sp. DSM 41037]RPK91081.1 Lipoprotein CseA precursor [Streptomyces sp. ADI98-12]SUP57332.1 Lipoprotein CseA [Streptomyces griseus]GFH77298.1 lipoprotein CseA [Streptomyces gougerotii]GGU44688.1 lipoprotein CseA [Streptomyces diastaticus subsp. diastaticus]